MSATSMHRRRYEAGDPTRRMIGWGAVVAVHLVVLWALVTQGVPKSTRVAGKPPMQAVVIQEVTIPPAPQPKEIMLPKPKMPKEIRPPRRAEPKLAMPPSVVPRPAAPPSEVMPHDAMPHDAMPHDAMPHDAMPRDAMPAPAAAPSVASAPAPAPAVIASPAPAAPAAPQDIGVTCPKQVEPRTPARARRDGIEGVVKALATIRDGKVVDVQVLSGPRVFHSAVREAMLQYVCVAGPGEVQVTQTFTFRQE